MKKLFIKFSMMLFVLGMSTNTAWAFDQLMEQLNNEVYFAQMTATPSQTGSGKVYITGKTETFPADFDWDACAESSTVSRGIGAVVEGMDMVQVPFIMYCKANDGWYFKGWSYTQGGTDLEPLSREPGDEAIYDSHIGVLVNPSKQNGAENAKSYTIYATFDKIYVSNYSISGTNTVAKNGNITQIVTFNLVGNDLDANDFNAPSIVSTTGDGTWSSADGDDLVLSDVTINNPSKTATIDVKYIAPDEEDAQSTATLRFESKSGSRLDVVLSARTTSSSDVEAFLYNGNTKIGEGGTINDILNSDLSAYKNPILRLNKAHNGTIDIAKKITLDLNGYTLGGLTISTGADAVLAYSSFGGKISGNVNVNGGKLTLNGGSIEGAISISGGAELVQNGAAVTTVNNAGSLTTLDGTFSGTVTSGGTLLVKGGSFTGAPAIVTSGNATIQKGTIESATYGVESSGTTTIEKVVAIKGTTKALNITAGTTTLKCGRFESPDALVTGSGTLAFESAYFKSNSGLETYQGKQVWRVTVGTEYREGYNYFAGDREQALTAGLSVCRIGNTSYSSLEDAFAYANNTNEDVVIIMENDYTLPAGYYTLPANATLLVPMKENQDAGSEVVKRNIAGENDYIKPSKYRKLTLANGVNIDVHGTIEVSGSQLSTNETYTGAPFGPYGQIHMNGGSKMVLQNGSELRAWGFVTFDGNAEIDARRGSMVRELFQLGDWKDFYFSGRGLMANAGSKLGEEIFPITQYYIQNIEAPVKYHPGAKLSTATCVYAYFPQGMLGDMPPMNMNVIMTANNIPIVGVTGDDAMFLMDANADAENTWVRKWYDTSKDQQVYEINSGAHIGKLVIPLVYASGQENAVLDMNSGAYNLPITNNFKLHLLSGEMAFTQATALLPGAEVEVDKEAIVYVYAGSEGVRGGQLYVYDAEDWGEYAMNAKARQVKYSPSFEGAPNLRDTVNLVDASINVHGTFDTQGGFVYTTEGGANIFSSVEDAGTFIFTEVPTEEQKTATIAQVSDVVRESGAATRNIANCNLAYLRNSDAWVDKGGSPYVETEDAAAGTSFCYLDIDGQGGRWTNLQQRGCFTYESGSGTYYIKSQEYVAVLVTNGADYDDDPDFAFEGNSDHTFSDAAGAGRLFINLGIPSDPASCQWWEVEKKDNYYHCIHPDNDTYYYWDKTDEMWKEVMFTIKWKNWDGTLLQTYKVPYGTQAEWLSTNPTREKNLDYTYDFTGWTPALDKVTSNVTYTATFTAKQIKYTITFVQDGGVEIERHLLARNEMPVCENLPTRTGYILEWSPALAAVTGNQTYTATWLPEPHPEYEIKFMDYDGTTELQKGNVAVGSVPAAPVFADGKWNDDVDLTGKPKTEEYTYVFDHWSPALEEVSATSAKVYTAVYREVARNYTVYYFGENGTTPISSEQLPYGATPTPPAVSKENPEDGYSYTLVWKTLDESGTIQTVTGEASYKATFDRVPIKCAVTVKSNPSGAAVITGNGLYSYGSNVIINVDTVDGFIFNGWSDGIAKGTPEGARYSRAITVSKDSNLVANFKMKVPDFTIVWKNEDGSEELASVGQKANTATIYPKSAPIKGGNAQYSYTFYGWSTAANGGETIYKNGMTPKATKDATYYAYFTEKTREYTIYWRNENGTDIEVDHNQPYGAATSFSSALPTKQATAAATYTFDGWSTELNGDLAYLYGETPNVTGDATYYAHFASTPKTYTITWKRDDGSLIENTEVEYGAELSPADPTKPETDEYTYEFDHWTPALANVTGVAIYTAVFNAIPKVSDIEIDINESEDLAGETTVRNNLIISSTGVASGQLLGAENLSITGEAIFRLEQSFEAQTWYAVAVPWEVDPNTGIYNAEGVHLPTGNVYVIEFDANAYASADRYNGRADYWKYLDLTGNNMIPGKLYMVYLSAATDALEFHKIDGASIWTTSTSVAPASGSISSQSNWNAISNPALYHADMVTGATDGDVLKYNGNNSYIVASSTDMVVGQPIFAQVAASSTVYATVHSGASPAPAYRRAAEAATDANNRFVVELSMDDKLADRLIVQTAEEKADEYVIGKDLAKMSVGSKVAQMWINRYDTKLCKNTVALHGEQVDYPLTISAPKAGEYTLHNTHYTSDSDYTLYLTHNGEAIWNLSESDFVLTMEQGTTAEYGLRVSAKAPQVATGVDEAVVDAKGETKKVIINDKVFIIRGEKVYSIDGRLAK